MLTVILGFLYIALITTIIGFGVRKVLVWLLLRSKLLFHSQSAAHSNANGNQATALNSIMNNSLIQCIITGVVALTVYAEYISIFMNVGLICHLIMLAVTALICVLCRKDLFTADDSLFRTILKNSGLISDNSDKDNKSAITNKSINSDKDSKSAITNKSINSDKDSKSAITNKSINSGKFIKTGKSINSGKYSKSVITNKSVNSGKFTKTVTSINSGKSIRTGASAKSPKSGYVRLVIYSAIILVIAFYTSRGAFHTDTNIYHAQMIRIYEDYGLIKGMGNLQLHYAYNSAYLAFCSLFSMHFILPQPLHVTTGFLEATLALFAAGRLLDWHKHAKHVADISMLGIVIYIIVNITGSMSPATDYGTMFLSLYLICAWLINAEVESESETEHKSDYVSNVKTKHKSEYEASGITGIQHCTDAAAQLSEVKTYEYALLSVLALFTVSCKLSAAIMVLLMFVPLIAYIRRKDYLTIIKCLILGLLVFLPFLIRNYLISGWLFYPFESIDIFNVAWKIPVDYLRVDSDQIKVWGRCLYDVSLIDMPITKWFTIWWHEQRTYTRVLFAADAFGTLLLVADFFIAKMKQNKHIIDLSTMCLIITLYLSALMWLFTAPFVRYGLAFLLMIPLIAIGINNDLASPMHIPGKSAIVNRYGAIIVIAICFAPYLAHYFGDDYKFINQYGTEPYYVVQKDYDDAATGNMSLGGNTVYYSEGGEVNSYYYCPNTCYKFMLDRSELIGDTIKDGFKAKETTE